MSTIKYTLITALTTVLLIVTPLCQAEVQISDTQYLVFYHNDALGSPLAVTDHKGNTLWYEHNDPYGQPRDRVMKSGKIIMSDRAGTRRGYTGHTNDGASNLVYMKARYYDPAIGRFYSNDPVGYQANKPLSFNRYSYANNSPYRYIDPDGRQAVDAYGYSPTPPMRHQSISILEIGQSIDPNKLGGALIGIGIASVVLNTMNNTPDDGTDETPDSDTVDTEKTREKGKRFNSGDDALQQLEEIENAQRQVRTGRSNQIIDNIEKSKQRAKNALKPHNIDLNDYDSGSGSGSGSDSYGESDNDSGSGWSWSWSWNDD